LISKELTLLKERVDDFNEKGKKVIAQLYHGVFSKRITFREGKIYYYRGSDPLGLPDIVQELSRSEYGDIFKAKIGKEKAELLKEIFSLRNLVDKIDRKLSDEYDTICVKFKPVEIITDEERTNACMISIDSSGEISLLDDREDEISTNEIYTQAICLKLKEELDKGLEKPLMDVKELNIQMDKINDILKIKGGKYLIASSL
jgi:hypothetical protein